jgi:hypothetical protein
MRPRCVAATFAAALGLAGLFGTTSRAGTPIVHVGVLVRTTLPLGDVTWTGRRLVYVAESTGEIAESGSNGLAPRPFAMLPKKGEEDRCRIAPPGHGFTAGDLYCHTADNSIFRVTPGGRASLFAVLPERRQSDGALAFDTSGRFGFALLLATGRSSDHHGGAVFAVDAHGSARQVGSYPGPGGAENAAIAPTSFGAVAGELLLTTDKASDEGRLLAVDEHGRVRQLAEVHGDGLNSLAVIRHVDRVGVAPPGLYIADTRSKDVWFARAHELSPYAGSVVVAAELKGWLFVVERSGTSFRTIRLRTNLIGGHYNFEGAAFLP